MSVIDTYHFAILSKSAQGFRCRAIFCAPKCLLGYCLGSNHLQPLAKTQIRTLTQNTSQDAGSQDPNLTLTSTSPFRGPFSTAVRNFRQKTALTLDVLPVNSP